MRAERTSRRSRIKFADSTALAGYSQSTSMPSKPRSASSLTADEANRARDEGVEAAAAKFVE